MNKVGITKFVKNEMERIAICRLRGIYNKDKTLGALFTLRELAMTARQFELAAYVEDKIKVVREQGGPM